MVRSLLPCLCAFGLAALVAVAGAGERARSVPAEPAADPAVVVRLDPVASVGSREVRVRDVATVQGGPAELRERIAALDLDDAPPPGGTSELTREQVVFRIRLAGVDPSVFRVEGTASTRLVRETYEVPEADMLAAARRLVLARLPWDPADITVQPAPPARGPVRVSGRKDDVHLDATLRSDRLPLGKVRVDVAVSVENRKQAEVPLMLDVRVHQGVAVATRRIERGQKLTDANVRFERRALDGTTDYLTTDRAEGQQAKRTILPGQIITAADSERAVAVNPVLIKQRDVVQIVFEQGALRVTAKGEALQNGRRGEVIRLRNVDSRADVWGRVLENSLVELVLLDAATPAQAAPSAARPMWSSPTP